MAQRREPGGNRAARSTWRMRTQGAPWSARRPGHGSLLCAHVRARRRVRVEAGKLLFVQRPCSHWGRRPLRSMCKIFDCIAYMTRCYVGKFERNQPRDGEAEDEAHCRDQRRRHRGLRGPALADGRRPARQHGRRRVQARRARPHLSQVHLRRLRRAARQARSGPGARRRPEDPDEYRSQNIFWVPSEARWSHLKAQAKQPTVGQIVDDAMAASSVTTRRSRVCCPRTTPPGA